MKTFNKFSSLFLAASLAVSSLGFTACSDDKDEIQFNPYGKSDVVLTYFGVMPVKRGESIAINGENLDKVKAVIFPIDVNVEEFELVDKQNINVVVPEEASAGKLRLLTTSGDTITSVSHLSFAEEISVTKVEPTTGLLPGDEITVTGEAVYNIASITFSDGVVVESTGFVSADRHTLVVKVPRGAVSGPVSFSDGNDDEPWTYTYPTPLDIINATVTAIDKTDYEFEEIMTITGTHLEFVDKVTFPGSVEPEGFTVSEDGTALTVEIPEECGPGQVELTLASGLVLTTPGFNLPVIKITGVTVDGADVGTTDVTDEETGEVTTTINSIVDFEAGMEVVIAGENLDCVKRVFFPGYTDKMVAGKDYQQSSTEIRFTIPENMSDGNIQLYQNKTISVYQAAEKLVALPYLWKGEVVMAGWGGSLYPATWDPALWKKFMLRDGSLASGPGVMTIYYTPDATSDQNFLKMTYGDWTTPWVNVAKDENFDSSAGAIAIGLETVSYKVEITQEDIDKFLADGSFVFYGTGLTMTAVKYEPGLTLGGGEDEPTETEIQVFTDVVDIDMGTSLGSINLECKPATSLVDAGMEPGNVLRIYITPTADYNMDNPAVIVKLFNGHWEAMSFPDLLGEASPSTPVGEEDLQFNEVSWGDMTKIDIPITVDVYQSLQYTDWGYGLILQGQNLIFNKIVLVQ